MDLYTFITSYLTIGLFNTLIERKRKVSSAVFDQVFAKRTQRATATVSLTEIAELIGSVPVVARGAMSYPLGGRMGTNQVIEPMPIRLSKFFSGAQLNDLKALYGTGDEAGQALVQTEIDRKILSLMESTDRTRNALCAQAITGRIDYQMHVDGGFERYIVEYGQTQSFIVNKPWNSRHVALGAILKELILAQKALNQEGFSGEVGALAGIDVFVSLIDKINALPQAERLGATIDANIIRIAGFTINLANGYYDDRNAAGTVVSKPEIASDGIVLFAKDYPELTYCAVDDIDGKLEATPFFAKSVVIPDPSGVKVISESKPLPLVSPKGFVVATVFDAAAGGEPILVTNVEKTYTADQLDKLTKAKILSIAATRGYEMTKTDADSKADIIVEFLSLQAAVQE